MNTPPETEQPATGGRAADVRFGESADVPITPVIRTYAEIAAKRTAANDGKHSWVIRVIFELADPEVALDDLECGPDNMVGLMPIICFWCHQEYPRDGSGVALNATWCPGRPATIPGDGA